MKHVAVTGGSRGLGAGLIDPREAKRLMGDVELREIELPAEVS